VFYLRGHRQPKGAKLPVAGDLPVEYSRGLTMPDRAGPAHWSDGSPISAQDFVYSWRRALDPSTAAPDAFLMYTIQNAEECAAGRIPTDKLAVRVLDEYSLRVDLRFRAPFFLQLVSSRVFCPVPRHAVRSFGGRWLEPGVAVTSGPYILKERRPYDRMVLTKNPHYYDARQVALEEVVFLTVADASPMLNLYKAGIGAVVQPWVPAIMPTLRRKKDFRPQPTYATLFWLMNTATPPLNDVRLRYALKLATDNRPLAALAGAGSTPAHGLVPPTPGFPATGALPVSIEGKGYDVLSFNPSAAREIFDKAGRPSRLECLVPSQNDAVLAAEVLQAQWKANIGVDLAVVTQELPVWVQSVRAGKFRHIAAWGSPEASYLDPEWFLDLFSHGDGWGSGWNDPLYNETLSQARAASDPEVRMARLGECERLLLRAMPIIPISHDVQPQLRKPYLRGLASNLLNREQFKYAWIDTDWSPS
jgi:oligopeptide transport system substrate-binding protein